MRDKETISLLEKRVRDFERLAADCILEGDVMRLQQSVALYRRSARVPRGRKRVNWPALSSRRRTAYGWPSA